ncbi:Zn-dependent hydrolase [Alkalicoccus urumqiensis]|uniref:Zn-dependent hydrolase n=1 Tax=Alkalicoccus urumqiensis TaxID=1548213 RepID=A0A2P6MLT8_ALKUR|nr:Zn-dependent hydrolase [Alkalicoccus urumqiensis]PRO67200.1 Zn-dependent hydrolase [Alkalicoccus urumqiensis]
MLDQLLKDYNEQLTRNGVDGRRLAERLTALSEIGKTEAGGCRRIAFSPEEQQAKELVMGWMEEAGLQVTQDGAGNVIGVLHGTSPERSVLSGSHVDSVPDGGHFDGPLGVLAALEVAEAWKTQGIQPVKTYEVIIFTDEEGARFQSGLTGSQAMTGQWEQAAKAALSDTSGKSFESVLSENDLSFQSFREAERDFSTIDAFVEVHIEQGKRLEKEDLPVGIVQGIAGPSWLNVSFQGAAGHAGNTPMNDRRDALIAAGRFVSAVEVLPPKVSGTSVATVGKLEVKPNGVNVIPGEVNLTVDIRDIEEDSRDKLRDAIWLLAEEVAEDRGIDVEIEQVMYVAPVKVKQDMQDRAARALEKAIGRRTYFLPSGAGHDAMMVGRKTDVAMLFTRSQDGISHNPAEWSTLNDCVETVHVLKELLEDLCGIRTEA